MAAVGFLLVSCAIIPIEPYSQNALDDLQLGVTRPEEAIELIGKSEADAAKGSFASYRGGRVQIFTRQNELLNLLEDLTPRPFQTQLLILEYDANYRLSIWHQAKGYTADGPASFPAFPEGTQVCYFKLEYPIFDQEAGRHYLDEAQFHHLTLRVKRSDVPDATALELNKKAVVVGGDHLDYIIVPEVRKIVILAPLSEDLLAKGFRPDDNRALIYIQGANRNMTLYLDGQFVTRGWEAGYVCWNVAPGEHVIAVKVDPVRGKSNSCEERVRINHGSIRFFEVVGFSSSGTPTAKKRPPIVEIIPRRDEAVFDEIRSKRLILDALPFPIPEESQLAAIN